ncbi:phage head closure protein [Rhodopseudomonas parapalustris]
MNPGELRHKIKFEFVDIDTEIWSEYYSCYAKVNAAGGKEYFSSGAEQSTNAVIFTVRYCNALKNIYLNTQSYRIKFQGAIYDISDVDNYMFQNQFLKIKAVGRHEV